MTSQLTQSRYVRLRTSTCVSCPTSAHTWFTWSSESSSPCKRSSRSVAALLWRSKSGSSPGESSRSGSAGPGASRTAMLALVSRCRPRFMSLGPIKSSPADRHCQARLLISAEAKNGNIVQHKGPQDYHLWQSRAPSKSQIANAHTTLVSAVARGLNTLNRLITFWKSSSPLPSSLNSSTMRAANGLQRSSGIFSSSCF